MRRTPKVDLDKIAIILLDAQDLGDAAAGEKHKITRRSISRYRKRHGEVPEVKAKLAAAKQQLAEGWLNEARETRRQMLARVQRGSELVQARMEQSDTAKDAADGLRALNGAFKIVDDAIRAEELLNEGEGDFDGGQPGSRPRVDRQGGAGAKIESAARRLDA